MKKLKKSRQILKFLLFFSFLLAFLGFCQRLKCGIFVHRLSGLLCRNKLVDLLIGALEQFGQPNSLFKVRMSNCNTAPFHDLG